MYAGTTNNQQRFATTKSAVKHLKSKTVEKAEEYENSRSMKKPVKVLGKLERTKLEVPGLQSQLSFQSEVKMNPWKACPRKAKPGKTHRELELK